MSKSSAAGRGKLGRSDPFVHIAYARDARARMAGLPARLGGERTAAFRGAASIPVMAAGNAFVSACASPGYDAFQKDEQAPGGPLAKITLMNKSGAPERPQAGGGNTGREP